jgi:hypothetical protein
LRDRNPVEFLQRRSTALAQRSADLKKLADAWQPLYQTLSPDQKKRMGHDRNFCSCRCRLDRRTAANPYHIGVDPPGEARSDFDVFVEVAKGPLYPDTGDINAFIQTTVTLGLALALIVIVLCRQFIDVSSFSSWGWRIPFIVSIVLLAFSIYITAFLGWGQRRSSDEENFDEIRSSARDPHPPKLGPTVHRA